MTSALSVERVRKAYAGHVAVQSLSFEVPRGAVCGLLGPNGSGKTTTLRMINDIIAPDSGAITLFGELTPGPSAAPRIGYLPEERGLYPKMKVLPLLRFFGELRGLSGKDAIARGKRWLERLELSSWAQAKVQDLSKGMQQKVQFAASLIHDPEFVILDEPWSGLDPINAEVLQQIVRDMRADGRTVLFSTHLMEQAEKICDRVCIIARGQKVVDGVVKDVKREAASDAVSVVFADAPSNRVLVESVLSNTALVKAHQSDGERVLVELGDGISSSRFLSECIGAGVDIEVFSKSEPTLHQIFVDKVRELDDIAEASDVQ